MYSKIRRRRGRNRPCIYCERVRRGTAVMFERDKRYPDDPIEMKSPYWCFKCFKGAQTFKEDYIVWEWDD